MNHEYEPVTIEVQKHCKIEVTPKAAYTYTYSYMNIHILVCKNRMPGLAYFIVILKLG